MISKITENWTIVIVGNWNISIFNPRWLSENIFGKGDIRVEIPINFGANKMICNGVVLIPLPDKLIIGVSEINDENLSKREEKACEILKLLPHTPVYSIGINFAFDVKSEEPALFQHFPDPDLQGFSENDLKTIRRSRGWRFEHEDWILNLNWNISDKQNVISFNFHADRKTCEQLKTLIEGKTAGLEKRARLILKNIYDLEE